MNPTTRRTVLKALAAAPLAGLGGAARALDRPSGAVVFVAGSLAERVVEVGRAIVKAAPGIPVCLAAGAGVVSERGEVEGQAAATGLVWSGGSAEPFSVSGHNAEALGSRISDALKTSEANGRVATALVFARPNGLAPHVLEHPDRNKRIARPRDVPVVVFDEFDPP